MNSTRTHYVGQLSPEMKEEEVVLCGWMHEHRDLGGIQFLLLRDHTGIAQLTMVKKYVDEGIWEKAKHISRESVLSVRGKVQAEGKAPGGFEVIPDEIDVLAAAFYSRKRDALTPRALGILSALRVLAIGVIAFFMLQPVLRLTRIMRWYKQDFVDKDGSLEAFVLRYLDDPARSQLTAEGYTIEFKGYDWALNDSGRPATR